MRPSCRGKVRWARGSTGKCILKGGEGIFFCQSRGRYTQKGAFVSCLDESWALKEEREGKDSGSLAEPGSAYGGAQATLRAAKRLLYLK